jgi:hypothetical protein
MYDCHMILIHLSALGSVSFETTLSDNQVCQASYGLCALRVNSLTILNATRFEILDLKVQ